MENANLCIIICLGLMLCACAGRPAAAPAAPIMWTRSVLPHSEVRPKRLPVKQQIKDMQARIDALETYLQGNDELLARRQYGEDQRNDRP